MVKIPILSIKSLSNRAHEVQFGSHQNLEYNRVHHLKSEDYSSLENYLVGPSVETDFRADVNQEGARNFV